MPIIEIEKRPVLFTHDCKECTYLGSYMTQSAFVGRPDSPRDYYHCKARSLSPQGSIIARWSSAGRDYSSFEVEAFDAFGPQDETSWITIAKMLIARHALSAAPANPSEMGYDPRCVKVTSQGWVLDHAEACDCV